ncbi:hypothetical protein [Bradyrhizobium tropiciagri]|uniref:hypothetical protein n=1 Tax=Bradyrhizobium tropiciagri TaxID=312253 RepID=UPI00138F74E1|nr:hypothetical protein [Bradyrhizobium tropiciagri]
MLLIFFSEIGARIACRIPSRPSDALNCFRPLLPAQLCLDISGGARHSTGKTKRQLQLALKRMHCSWTKSRAIRPPGRRPAAIPPNEQVSPIGFRGTPASFRKSASSIAEELAGHRAISLLPAQLWAFCDAR